MIVVYATAADEVAEDGRGRNSPFTSALLTRIDEPGLEITQMLKQVGADVSAHTGGRQRPEITVQSYNDYFLNQSDRIAWEKIKDSGDPSALQDFIRRFRSSTYYAVALDRLARLAPSVQDIPPQPELPNPAPHDQPVVTPPVMAAPAAQPPVQPAGPLPRDHVATANPDAMATTTPSDRPDNTQVNQNMVPRTDQAGDRPDKPSAAAGTGIHKGAKDPPDAARPGKHSGAKGNSSIRPPSSGDAGPTKTPQQQIANAEKPSRPAVPPTMTGQGF
jgi:hypothetical protein